MKQNRSYFLRGSLLFWLTLCLVVACSAEPEGEPTTILPPPNVDTVDSADDDSVVGAAATSTAVISESVAEQTAEPTPTLEPTVTPELPPTLPPRPVTDPPIQTITSGPMPATARDLLFIADGAFKQWNHNNRQIETIVSGPDPAARVRDDANRGDPFVGDVTDYVVSPDGKRAVVARVTYTEIVTRTTSEATSYEELETLHELLFVDMVSREVWTIVPQVDNLRSFALSPDTRQLTFIGTGIDGIPETAVGDRLPTAVYVMATGGGNPGPVRDVYHCQDVCFSPVWHPESNLVVFADNTALWLFNITAEEAEPLIENRAFEPDIESLDQIAIYSPIAWARNGRYLLTFKGGWEGGSRVVFDVPTQQLVEVPGTFTYAGPFLTEVMWMPDTRLFVLRTEDLVPKAELWRFSPESGQIVLEESAVLSDLPMGAVGQQYLEDGRFAFGLNAFDANDAGAHQAAGIYLLTSLNEEPQRVNAIPVYAEFTVSADVYWSANGTDALIVQHSHVTVPTVYYGPADGDFLYDVSVMLGQGAHAFHWQPEIVVP